MLRKYQEIIRFCLVGTLATGIHYGIYLLLNQFVLACLFYRICNKLCIQFLYDQRIYIQRESYS